MAMEDTSENYNQDIISLILVDHRRILDTFDQYEQESDINRRELIVREAIRELSLHASKEEMTLYESLRQNNSLPNGKEMAEHGWHEHEDAKKLLYELDMKLKPTDVQFDLTMKQIIKMLRHHIKEEEEEIFPSIKKFWSEQKLIEIGKSYISHQSIAVTRPHPAAPDKGLMGKIANAATKPLDEMRDAIHNASTSSK